MTSRELKVHDVVRIEDERLHPNWKADAVRGEIVECGIREHRVRLGVDLLSRFPGVLSGPYLWIRRSRLSRDRWPTPQDRAEFLFGHVGCYYVRELPLSFSAQGGCMHVAHDTTSPPLASRRILLSCFGFAVEFDACVEHEHLDGSCVESVPLGRRWRLAG